MLMFQRPTVPVLLRGFCNSAHFTIISHQTVFNFSQKSRGLLLSSVTRFQSRRNHANQSPVFSFLYYYALFPDRFNIKHTCVTVVSLCDSTVLHLGRVEKRYKGCWRLTLLSGTASGDPLQPAPSLSSGPSRRGTLVLNAQCWCQESAHRQLTPRNTRRRQ